MIHTLKEELHVLILLVIYGIYLMMIYDLFEVFKKTFKLHQIIMIILEIILWVMQVYITYLFSYKILDGYIPLYFVLFIIVGAILYILIAKNQFKKQATKIMIIIKILSPKINKELKNIFLPQWIINYFKEIFKYLNHRKKSKKYKFEIKE